MGSWTPHGARDAEPASSAEENPEARCRKYDADTFALSQTGDSSRNPKVPVLLHTSARGGAEAVPGRHTRTYHGHW